MRIVIVQVARQPHDEFFGRCEVASFEPTTSERAEPEFDLVEPRAVLRSKMKDMLVVWIGKEGASVATSEQAAF